MHTPIWALTLAYWLHMLATIAWVGGLAALAILVFPAARQTLEPKAYADLLGSIQRRLDPLGWFSLALLAATGLIQMSANPNYSGFLAITNRWAVAIFLKHLIIIAMVGISAYFTWGLIPVLRRFAIRRAAGQAVSEIDRLQRREIMLLRINLILGVLVLALTAIARAS
jgi:uncharacterized membrane protein